MTQHQDNINARLKELYADYRRQLPASIAHISQLFETYCTQSAPSAAATELHYALHKLAGSGATFGHSEMGNIARVWEHRVAAIIEAATPITLTQQQEMRTLLEQLSRAATLPAET